MFTLNDSILTNRSISPQHIGIAEHLAKLDWLSQNQTPSIPKEGLPFPQLPIQHCELPTLTVIPTINWIKR